MLAPLLRNDDILHAGKQRLAFAQAQPKRFHRQFPSLYCQHLLALFGAIRVDTYDLDPDTHDQRLRVCANAFNRALVS